MYLAMTIIDSLRNDPLPLLKTYLHFRSLQNVKKLAEDVNLKHLVSYYYIRSFLDLFPKTT